MGHGMPPFQQALNHGILPSLSPDVDTEHDDGSVLADAGRVLSAARVGQRPRLQGEQPGESSGPAAAHVASVHRDGHHRGSCGERPSSKVGTLTPGKEADIVVLEARSINTWPMNNVPGTIVTMMNPRHVRDVLIAGKVVYWKGKLVGWNIDGVITPARAGARSDARADQWPGESRRDSQGQQQFQQPLSAEFPGQLLLQRTEQHVAGVCLETVAVVLSQRCIGRIS